jgi:hypothetical protein
VILSENLRAWPEDADEPQGPRYFSPSSSLWTAVFAINQYFYELVDRSRLIGLIIIHDLVRRTWFKGHDFFAELVSLARLICHATCLNLQTHVKVNIVRLAAFLHPSAHVKVNLARFSVRSLTGLAVLLAGRQGPTLRAESASHLAGESGHDPVTRQKVKEALGFLITGAKYRCSNLHDAAWKPIDLVLGSRFMSGLFVAIPTVADTIEVWQHKGSMTVLTSFGSIFGVGTALAGAIKSGRKYRGIELPEPKANQARKDGQDT